MGEIIIHIDPTKLSPKAVNTIKAFGPKRHAAEVRFKHGGATILCGRATVYQINKVLKKHGVPVEKIVEFGQGGVIRQLSSRLGAAERQAQAPTIPSQSEIFMANRRESSVQRCQPDPVEQAYLNNLERLDGVRGLALDDALTTVSELVNALADKKGPPLKPYHLVDFVSMRSPDGRDRLKPSLAELDKIEPVLSKTIWDYIHAHERGKDTGPVQQGLDTSILSIVEDRERLGRLKSLAASSPTQR